MCVHDPDLEVANVGFLPIVSAYATRLGLVEEIDRVLDCKMAVTPRQDSPGSDAGCPVGQKPVAPAARVFC